MLCTILCIVWCAYCMILYPENRCKLYLIESGQTNAHCHNHITTVKDNWYSWTYALKLMSVLALTSVTGNMVQKKHHRHQFSVGPVTHKYVHRSCLCLVGCGCSAQKKRNHFNELLVVRDHQKSNAPSSRSDYRQATDDMYVSSASWMQHRVLNEHLSMQQQLQVNVFAFA